MKNMKSSVLRALLISSPKNDTTLAESVRQHDSRFIGIPLLTIKLVTRRLNSLSSC